METNRQILIYGNSIILGSIGVSLQRYPGFDVTTLTTPLSEAQQIDNTKPDILILDLKAPHTEAIFSLLKADPNLLLTGISPGINMVDFWSGRQLRDLSMQSLLELIKSAAND